MCVRIDAYSAADLFARKCYFTVDRNAALSAVEALRVYLYQLMHFFCFFYHFFYVIQAVRIPAVPQNINFRIFKLIEICRGMVLFYAVVVAALMNTCNNYLKLFKLGIA